MKENEYEINGVWYKIKPNEMEFIDEITTQLTEQTFGENTYATSSEVGQEGVLMFQEDAHDYYNERYDEIETLYIKLIKENK